MPVEMTDGEGKQHASCCDCQHDENRPWVFDEYDDNPDEQRGRSARAEYAEFLSSMGRRHQGGPLRLVAYLNEIALRIGDLK
jgi:hypothetical protein